VSGKVHAPGACLWRMSFWCPLNIWRRSRLQIRFGPFEEGSGLLTLRGIESGSLGRPSHSLASVSCVFLPALYACLVCINSSTAKTYNRSVLDRRLVTVSMNTKCLRGWVRIAFNLYQTRVECLLLLCDVRKGEKSQQSVSFLAPNEQGSRS
jgi:hypothetical protein